MLNARQIGICALAAGMLHFVQPAAASAQPAQGAPEPAQAQSPDGGHDFDFLIGAWRTHLRKLAHPLTGSSDWLEYDGTSVTRKILGGNANLEEFEVDNPGQHLHIHAQTLRLYNTQSRQWSIYLLDVNKGVLSLPATVGQFTDGRGELFDQEEWNGRWIEVRYVWTTPSPTTARMEQSFSTDGGKTWEVNWIDELTRAGE